MGDSLATEGSNFCFSPLVGLVWFGSRLASLSSSVTEALLGTDSGIQTIYWSLSCKYAHETTV